VRATEIAPLEPALGWLKNAALYPADEGMLGRTLGSLDVLRVLRSGAYPEEWEIREVSKGDPAAFLEKQQVEFTALFINRKGGVVAPPYASVYLSPGVLFGEAAEEVAKLYAEGGLEWAPRPGAEAPDHLTVELEFLQHLARLSRDESSAEGAEALWNRFWRGHLNRWLPGFVEKLAAGAVSPVYRLLASALTDLMKKEKNDE
jgi:putative dimethyl sulfoxide reductase chaperone